MATLPASGYLSDAARTKAEQKVALEDQRDFIAQMFGGSVQVPITISAGSITPTNGLVALSPESGTFDNLDNIVLNLPDGSMLLLIVPQSSDRIDIRGAMGGIGQIELNLGYAPSPTWDEIFPLTFGGAILLRREILQWREVARAYGPGLNPRSATTIPMVLDWLGTKTAADYDNADANLDAGKLGGVAAALYALKADPVGDAETLDGIDSTGFLQLAFGGQQVMAGNLRNETGRFIARAPDGAAPGLELIVDDGAGADQLRSILFFNDVDNTLYLRLYDTDGSTVLGQLRITDTGGIDFDDGLGGGFRSLWDAKSFNGQDELTVSDARYTEFDHIMRPSADVPGYDGSKFYWVAPKAMTWFSVNGNTDLSAGDIFLDAVQVTGPELEYVLSHLMPRDPAPGPVAMIYEISGIPGGPFASREQLRFVGEYVTAHDPSYSFTGAFYATLESTPTVP